MPYLPSITTLRCLDASARAGTFTRAAQQLHLTQSSVSHHILNLEHQLGVKLFEREGGRVELTPAGRMYWEEILPAIEQLQRATREVIDLKGGRNTLNVGVPPSFANTWLMPRVCDFVSNNTDITLNLRNDLPADKSGDEQVDARIELSEANAPGIVSVPLLSLVYRPYASPTLLRRLKLDHLYAEAVLPDAALVQLLRSSALIRTSMTESWEGWLRVSGLEDSVNAAHLSEGPDYRQASLALIAVMNGTGVALLPKHVAEIPCRSGAIVRLNEMGWRPRKAYHLEWSATRPVRPPLRRFAEWAASVAESES